ncbi:ABC transporter B family member 15 [Cajanus cajan]|uniref:ABC transporter B family member 15 n=1 Tax=Cajanus cajan TaxID=3821 RepID=A0A151QX50_CAJCA|nr:ABC transporter B family member 15 [Cajanus cajan]KYP34884.1 ABC transporter B family member 15 [Cajanus cajan]
MGRESVAMDKKNKKIGSTGYGSIFMHADRKDWFFMIVGTIGAVGEGLTTPLVLLISSRMMNNIGSSSNMDGHTFIHNIDRNAVAWLYLAGASFAVCFLEGYCWTRTSERQAARMRHRYLKAVLRQDVAYFDLHVTSTSEIITSVSNDSLVIQDVLSEKVPNFLMNISLFVGSYIAAFAMLWRLAIVGFPFVVLLVIPGLIYGKTLMGLSCKIRDEYNVAGTVAEQAISSIRTVYSFVGESKTLSAFSNALQGTVKLGLKQGLAKGLAIGSNGVVFAIWSFMCYYGSRLVIYHGVKGGTVFAVGAALAVGGLGLGVALSNMKYFSEAGSAAERIKEVIKRVPDIDSDNRNGEILERVYGEVEFEGVEFAYPSRPDSSILNGLSVRIPAGKRVALVGESGSGKSTVIALLQRFYDPVGGEIRLDGVGIQRLQVKWLRAQMGLVSQEPALFATSIKENILFGKEDATDDQVVEAAKASHAHNFISLLPHGYDTQVGERGIQMSGGQKQRIAIARAIIKKPRILLLDEATSALDSESERIVQEALDNVASGCTAIIIAHRLSTVQNADLIAVVQRGKVVEMGSHNDLMQSPAGAYASAFRLQQKTDKAEEEQQQQQPVTPGSVVPFTMTPPATETAGPVGPTRPGDHDDVAGGKNKARAPSFRRLLALSAPEWKHVVLGCLNAMVFGAVQPVYAFTMGSTILMYFNTDHEEIVRKTRFYSFCFLGLFAVSFLSNIGQHYCFGYMGEYLTKRVRENVLSKILTFEVGWFDLDENSSGAVCSRLAKDANVVRSLVGDRMALLVQTFSAVLTAYTMGLIISWRLSIVMIAVQPVIIACFYTRRVLLKSMSDKAVKAQQQSSKLASEAVSNLRTVTAFSSQDRILKMLDQAQQGPSRENVRQSWFAGLGLGVSQGIASCIWALDFWYGGRLISSGYITTKTFFESFMVLVSTGRIIADAGSMTTDLSRGADVVGSVFGIIDRCTKIEPDDPNGNKAEKLVGEIELHDVHFAYPTRPDVGIFQGFSIKIEAGKSTALVGQSGSGKSTIIGLIERFYDPLKGIVTIDGMDIKSYNLKSLRKHIALVSQEPTLFGGTIRENIAYGATCEKVDESEIMEAARAANAHDFIASLKEGYETWCGEKGVQLSGGQKQRIAIARAILKKPKVLLLDEATSALDGKSEKVVQETLMRVMIGRTSVVVAHRLSTIQNCDVIGVLEKGKVVEIGTHSSLLAKGPCGAYYSLVNLQTRHAATINNTTCTKATD